MNIRWPLWLPATTKDLAFFLVLFGALVFLLLGQFNSLPLIPTFDQMPTSPGALYLWLLAITAANYLIVVKHARNDYISISEAAFPSAVTWALFTAFFLLAVTIHGLSIDWSNWASNENFRTLLYAQVHVFVVLNISLLFKDNNSPVRDIAREIQSIREVSRRRKELPGLSQEERKNRFHDLGSVLEALKAGLAKNAASFNKSHGQTSGRRISQCVDEAIELLRSEGPEIAFHELSRDDSKLFQAIKCIAEYSP
jgi:hypothetical protein